MRLCCLGNDAVVATFRSPVSSGCARITATRPTHTGDVSVVVSPGRPTRRSLRQAGTVELLLWILAVILVIAGFVALVRGQIVMGIVLIVVGLLVGPGGVSIFT